MVPRKRRAAVFSFSSPSFRSAFPPPFSSSSLPQVQILVRVPAAERQKQEQKEGDTKKPHFELLEGCRPETTVADLKRQVEFFFFFFCSPPLVCFFLFLLFRFPTATLSHVRFISLSFFSSLFLYLFLLNLKQIAAKGYSSGSFDLPPRHQRLCLAGRALGDDAATLRDLGLAEAFVEQVAGFVVFDDTEEKKEG